MRPEIKIILGVLLGLLVYAVTQAGAPSGVPLILIEDPGGLPSKLWVERQGPKDDEPVPQIAVTWTDGKAKALGRVQKTYIERSYSAVNDTTAVWNLDKSGRFFFAWIDPERLPPGVYHYQVVLRRGEKQKAIRAGTLTINKGGARFER